METIFPSQNTTFMNHDWLIGNHSDELTPWIPVMAAATSHHTKFMVLPCCPFEFHKKFQRKTSGISVYRDHLNYVKEVSAIEVEPLILYMTLQKYAGRRDVRFCYGRRQTSHSIYEARLLHRPQEEPQSQRPWGGIV